MDKDRKNRIFLILIVIFLLLFVVGIGIYEFFGKKKENNNKLNVSIVEIYASDYELIKQGDFFLGIKDNKVYLVLSSDGKELYRNEEGMPYQSIFETRDGSFLLYDNRDNILSTMLYDEDNNSFINLQTIDKVNYAKPIVYEGKDKKYVLGFCSNDDDNLYLYNSNVGIKVLNHTSLVADKYDQKKDLYFTYTEYIVVRNSTGMVGLIDVYGNTMVDYQYNNIVGLKNNKYIVINKNNTYNVIDNKGNKLLDNDYQYISYKDGYYFVMKNNKVAIFDEELTQLSGFIMNHNIGELNLREDNYFSVRKINNKYYMWNNDGMKDFTYNDLYIVSNKKDNNKYNIGSFGISDFIYNYIDGELVIYNNNFEEIKRIGLGTEVKYVLDITTVENGTLFIEYINNDLEEAYCYVNSDGTLYNNKNGKMIRKTDNYLVYKKNKELVIVNYNGEVLNNIKGEDIKISASYLIVDNNLYKIIIK